MKGRRLVSLTRCDMQNKNIDGKAFLIQDSDTNSDRLASKYGAKIIN